MKMKKFVALALAAVMAVSVLTGCGGGSGASGSLSTNKVNSLLSEAGSNIKVVTDSSLNVAVRSAAEDVASTGSTSSVNRIVSDKMGWSITGAISNALKDLFNGGLFLGIDTVYGTTYVVEETRLESSTGSGVLGSFGTNSDKIGKISPIDSPEKFAAAMILAADGSIGQMSSLTNDVVRFTYNVSASKAKTEDDTTYWIFGLQVTMHIL